MPVSIVIPAHDEEAVLGRCLSALLSGSVPGELDVVVVCNGCRDRTADVARSFGDAVRVVETPLPGKSGALALGDAAARHDPRLYVDADVVLPLDAVRRIAARLAPGGALAAAPRMEPDLSGSSWPVRAFYDVWRRMPHTREGMIGVGVYALSAEGRRRVGAFPSVIADDGYVRAHFSPGERVQVDDAPVRVVPPRTLGDLIRVKTRSRLGGYELRRRFPALMTRERETKRYGSAVWTIAARPWTWPAAAVYLWVNAVSRARARRLAAAPERAGWARDDSSRRPAPAGAAAAGP